MKKKIIFIILLLVIIVIGILFIKNSKKNNKEIENDIYGYLVYKQDEQYTLVELHSNSSNKEILHQKNMILSLSFKHNSLYYYYQNSDDRTTHFMTMSTKDLKPVELKVEKNGYSSMVDSDDDYIFTTSYGKEIVRTNRKNNEEKVVSNYPTDRMFIHNSRLYVESQNKYYSINLDGKNEKEITKEEFDKYKEEVGYKEEEYLYYEQYLIINDKKVEITYNQDIIKYDNKEIYKAEDGRQIMLYYTDKENKIAFLEYDGRNMSLEDPKYYIYDLETKELQEVTENDIYESTFIYTK